MTELTAQRINPMIYNDDEIIDDIISSLIEEEEEEDALMSDTAIEDMSSSEEEEFIKITGDGQEKQNEKTIQSAKRWNDRIR